MNRVLLIIILLIVWVAGCGPALITENNIDSHNYVIARADTLFEYTMPQLYNALVHSTLLPRGGTMKAAQVKVVLDSILCDTLAGFRADEIDLSQYYDYYRTYKQRYHRLLIARYLEEAVYKRVTVDSQEVVDFYFSRPDLFSVEEHVMLSQILIAPIGLKNGPDSLYYRSLTTEELVQKTAEYAQQIRRLLDFGEPFDEVARTYSHDVYSARQGGKVGWTKRNMYLDPFDSIAFSMKPGEISQPYQDQSGWHIIYIEDHVPEGIRPMEEEQYRAAREWLVKNKANKIGAPLKDSLFQRIQLEFNEELLDTNVYFVEKSTWAAIVNGQDTIDFNEMRALEEIYRDQHNVDNTTPEMKKAMLRRLAGHYALVQAARAMGIDTLPDVATEEAALRHKYSKTVVTLGSRNISWTPPPSLVEKYFNEHADELRVGKPFVVQHIIVDDSLFGEFLRDQALAGVDFIELAKEYYPGEPSIRADLANLGEIRPGEVPEEFYRAAVLTAEGGISAPVKTKYGYHIIKVISRADTTGIDQARHKIIPILKKEYAQQVFNKFRDELYAHFNVRFPRKIYPIHLKPLADRPR